MVDLALVRLWGQLVGAVRWDVTRALTHYDYNQPAAYSYEQAFQVLRTLRLPSPAAEQFFRRVVFNVVARNQ